MHPSGADALYKSLNDLMDQLDVAKSLRDDCFQELVVAYLEGKTEKQMTWLVIGFCRRSRLRGIELSWILNSLYKIHDYDDSAPEVMAILAYWTQQGALTSNQANYLWKHLMGDSAALIAEEAGKDRTTVANTVKKAIRNLRIVFGVESAKKNGRPRKERTA